MTASDPLPFTVNLWTKDRLRIEMVLAQCASLSVSRAAFDSAALSYPKRFVSLDGPGVLEIHSPRRPVSEGRPGRGITTDPKRLRHHEPKVP